jgi:hypothetical protein
MRVLTALSLAFITFAGAASAHAEISAQQASSRIKAAIAKSSKVTDKTVPFTEKLGPLVKGTKYVRSFRASNLHEIKPEVPGKFQPQFVIEGGAVVLGKINLRTEKVTITGVQVPRSFK